MSRNPIQRVIDAIKESWLEVDGVRESDQLVRAMCQIPSLEWKNYLDRYHVVLELKNLNPEDKADLIRLEGIGRHEDELYSSVADAIAEIDGLVRTDL